MACAGKQKGTLCLGELRQRIAIVRRTLDAAAPGSAEPLHSYTTVLSPRANIKTKASASEWNRVVIAGNAVSHVVTIRWTGIAFDARDRVRDGAGNLYDILSIENVNEEGSWMRLYCRKAGSEDRKAAR